MYAGHDYPYSDLYPNIPSNNRVAKCNLKSLNIKHIIHGDSDSTFVKMKAPTNAQIATVGEIYPTWDEPYLEEDQSNVGDKGSVKTSQEGLTEILPSFGCTPREWDIEYYSFEKEYPQNSNYSGEKRPRDPDSEEPETKYAKSDSNELDIDSN